MLSRLARWVRRQPDDVNAILPFDEVVAALGRTGERLAEARYLLLRSHSWDDEVIDRLRGEGVSAQLYRRG